MKVQEVYHVLHRAVNSCTILIIPVIHCFVIHHPALFRNRDEMFVVNIWSH